MLLTARPRHAAFVHWTRAQREWFLRRKALAPLLQNADDVNGEGAVRESQTERPVRQRGFTRRAAVVAVVLTAASVLWVREVELIQLRCQVTESAPPIPALAALLLLSGTAAALNRGLRRVAAGPWRWVVGFGSAAVLVGALAGPAGEAFSPLLTSLGAILGLVAVLCALAPRIHKRASRWALTDAEILVVFVFVSVSSVMSSCGVVRMFLPTLTVPRYFATPDNRFEDLAANLPPWYAPVGEETANGFFEGSGQEMPHYPESRVPLVGPLVSMVRHHVAATRLVPWGPWRVPLFVWMAFLTAYFVAGFSMVSLLRRRWSDEERLTYPLAELSLQLVRSGPTAGRPGFFSDPWMWVGFGLAFLHNLLNMARAFAPTVPALGTFLPVGQMVFTEQPWDALQGLTAWYRPEMVGLGYFVPLDILGSSTLFFGVAQLEKVVARASGIEVAGIPFHAEQAMGSFLVLGVFLLWGARKTLWAAIRRTFGTESETDGAEALPSRVAVLAFVVSAGVMLGIVTAAGLPFRVALVLFTVGALVLIVYARIRAETGAPNVWLFPFAGQRALLLNFAGTEALRGGPNYEGATILAGLHWLGRGYLVSVPASQLEGIHIARRTGMELSGMTRAILTAIVVGLVMALWMHLSTYYELGANVLEAGTIDGGYRTYLAREAYQTVADSIKLPVQPDRWRMGATVLGAVVTVGLVVLRRVLLRFPVHPLGFALPNTLSDPIWAPFLVVWIVKSTILQVGGVGTYRRLAPLFLGLALGHFFTAGILWGIASLYGGEAMSAYMVWFG